jgi:hypothetical protein
LSRNEQGEYENEHTLWGIPEAAIPKAEHHSMPGLALLRCARECNGPYSRSIYLVLSPTADVIYRADDGAVPGILLVQIVGFMARLLLDCSRDPCCGAAGSTGGERR